MFRLFRRRTIWLPTWPLVLLVLGGGFALLLALFFASHPFLAVHQPSPGAKVLVVESWLNDRSMGEVAELIKDPASAYDYAWLAGTEITYGAVVSELFDTYGEAAAATLEAQGVDPAKLRVAPGSEAFRHRSYSAAATLKEELAKRGETLEKFDVVSLGVHSRRSRLIYEKVFPDAEVGIISLPNPAYEHTAWYKTSVGMKNAIFEVIAYLYEKLADGGR